MSFHFKRRLIWVSKYLLSELGYSRNCYRKVIKGLWLTMTLLFSLNGLYWYLSQIIRNWHKSTEPSVKHTVSMLSWKQLLLEPNYPSFLTFNFSELSRFLSSEFDYANKTSKLLKFISPLKTENQLYVLWFINPKHAFNNCDKEENEFECIL